MNSAYLFYFQNSFFRWINGDDHDAENFFPEPDATYSEFFETESFGFSSLTDEELRDGFDDKRQA